MIITFSLQTSALSIHFFNMKDQTNQPPCNYLGDFGALSMCHESLETVESTDRINRIFQPEDNYFHRLKVI